MQRNLKNLALCYVTFLNTTRAYAQFAPYDVSILFPIKVSAAVDPVFKVQGDGMCNVIDLGKETSLITDAQFAEVTKQFLSREDAEPCQPQTLSSLKKSDSELLNGNTNLVAHRGMIAPLCKREGWKVVSLRYDPCADRSKRQAISVNDLQKDCRAELRLVAQPFFNYLGNWIAFDNALHLIYSAAQRAEIVTDLKAISELTKQSIATREWEKDFDGARNMLRPHPGLRNELDKCAGPVSQAISALIHKYARAQDLKSVAAMTSSEASLQWTFSLGDFTGEKLQIRREPFLFDNFSESNLSNVDLPKFPLNEANAEVKKVVHIGAAFDPKILREHGKLDNAVVQNLLGTLNDIANPRRISNNETTCFSCHATDSALQELTRRSASPFALGPRPFSPAPQIWPAFRKIRSKLNFRSFGYGPGFDFGVSMRVLHDSDDIVQILDSAK